MLNDRKLCPLCSVDVRADQLGAHVLGCGKKEQCSSCGNKFENLIEHIKVCPIRNNSYQSPLTYQSPSAAIYKPQAMKNCPICSTSVREDDYPTHLSTCSTRGNTPPSIIPKTTQTCSNCHSEINESDILRHVLTCSHSTTASYNSKQQTMKNCPICSTSVREDDYPAHLSTCSIKGCASTSTTPTTTQPYNRGEKQINRPDMNHHAPSHNPNYLKTTIKCSICCALVEEVDYPKHLDFCRSRQPIAPSNNRGNNMKKCVTCSRTMNEIEFAEHINKCVNEASAKQPETEDCIICFKPIAKVEYEKHVNDCLSKSSSPSPSVTPKPSKPTIQSRSNSCSTCSKPVNSSAKSSHSVPCLSKHVHCVECLQKLMNEHIKSKTAPVCYANHCDYELSRYDVYCLPVDANVRDQLLPLIQSTQRPQCPICEFYVDFRTMDDFQRHAISCDSENMVSCEDCHCLYKANQSQRHSQECRMRTRAQQQQALVDFLLPRTKYSWTAVQLRAFIEHTKKVRLPLDPHSIVKSLTIYGASFPLEVPTVECAVCLEARVYDDVFVFGCDEKHKLCYGCFEDACTAKMNNNEVLTCALCAYQLLDGEIKELRVSNDRKREFLDYQSQKTFHNYRDGTQGVIKCPKQGCKWIVEAQNPTERMSVTCGMCQYQFCSLCSELYHYRTTCQELREITQRWAIWCNTERGNYWQARAQQDATYQAQLQDYERQKAANAQRNGELQQRHQELMNDEKYKAQRCRLCPNCHRVVERIEGCDSMLCGRNYHGGDQQSGCGHSFKWPQAQPYVPMADAGPQQIRNDLARPEEQKAIVHEGIQCDSCHQQVQGVRFDCCHCASLIFCEKCEQRATLEHANQIREQGMQQHVFRLIPRPLNGDR
ncbi:unnamed protein product [Adineta ricciae]|uniref:RING-type domain-containing protein n=1 Tax=Adineta ricciae TaxID=249248 RepID=A0A814NHQ6_ADIRI|nr:unnamed protein product [Adineta ricciae]CAF1308228.1 unnamed protein product [Adineta ricciae]